MNSTLNIAAMVIHYHPTEQDWENTYYLSQFVPVLVVDNSEPHGRQQNDSKATQVEINAPSDACTYPIVIIENGMNRGVAKALNQGIGYWQSKNIDWCFLFDQDSKISQNFVQEMLSPILESQPQQMNNVAAWVPKYFATNLNGYGSAIQVSKWRIKRSSVCHIDGQEVKSNGLSVSYAITSGSLINMNVFDAIGIHDESLFIDFVDIEWGLRANAKGYGIRMNTDATLTHELGGEPIKWLGKRVVNHSPMRHYYYFRNVCHLLKMPHIPTVWKLTELYKLPLRFGFYALLGTQRKQHVKAMLSGLKDGLNNKTGKRNESTDHR
ncbi:glycosyltransferase family 2 protein [Vibrio sp. PNB23_22_6]